MSPLLQGDTETRGDVMVAGEDGCACLSAYETGGLLPVAAGLRCKLGLHDRMARTGYGTAPLQLLAGLLHSCGKVSEWSIRLTGLWRCRD